MNEDEKTRSDRELLDAEASLPGQETMPLSSLSKGMRFGRYEIIHRIGSGGMGTVYLAFDPVLDRKVALKVLHEQTRGAETEQRLLREAQAMARLNHPNVVSVHDAGMEGDRPYVAMEYVEGYDLRTWLRREKRNWHDILDAFLSAGEGLAAAHRAGLIHRDFKPGNVMIGNDGRVRVTDFGLARCVRAEELRSGTRTPTHRPAQTPAELSWSPLETPLTQAGTVLGTPSFMAPEQALDGQADHRSDQYAFCVALYVALFESHPLGEFEDVGEFVALLEEGELRPPPAGHGIPERIVDALMKGLSPAAQERYPDMAALLDALRPRAGAARRHVWILSVGVVAAALVVFGVLGFLVGRRPLCGAGEDQVRAVWNTQRRAHLEEHFVRVAGDFGRDAVHATATQLDDFSARWATVYREVCEATHLRGEHSEALLDRQMACLDRRLRLLDHVLTLLAAGDRELTTEALDAVLGLDRPEPCADTLALVERLPPPDDEEVQDALAELEEELAEADAERLTGAYEKALGKLEEMLPRARQLSYPPLLAELMISKGFVEAELSLADEAEHSLREAFGAAEQGRDDRAGAVAAANLMWVTGYLQGRFEEAERWSHLAEAKMQRLGGDDRVAADFFDQRAAVLNQAGRYDEAIETQQRALELQSRIYGPESLESAMALTTMGNALSSIGEYRSAVESYERSLALKTARVGSEHPTIGFTLTSLGQAYASLGENERAVELSNRALDIMERAFGADHPQLAVPLNNLAYSLESLGRLAEARRMHERAIDIVSRSWGPQHPQVAISLLNLSSLENQLGDLQAALAASQRAGEILTGSYGTEHPLYAYAANNTGVYLMKTGQPALAVVHLQKALAIRTSVATDPVLVGVTRFNLGKALWEAGQKELGRRSVVHAERELVECGEAGTEDLARARDWLASH